MYATHWKLMKLIPIALMTLVPADGWAQGSRPAGGPDAGELRARAVALFPSPPRYAEAARLLVRASNLRAETDTAAVNDLVLAAKLHAYAGQHGAARSTMERAAERALSSGDVLMAAHAYLDAAFIAIEQKDWERVKSLTSRAERLSGSPQLGAGERVSIIHRINPARLVAMAATGG